jgi:hypothetical protein
LLGASLGHVGAHLSVARKNPAGDAPVAGRP